MDIAAWLRELGLERYEPAFRDNEIDWEVLPELTDSELEKIGLPLGPRKKLLKAIAHLPAESSAVSAKAAPFARPVAPEAERRQLTVMFVDLVGSTALAGRLDPEDVREVMRGYQNTVAGEIVRFDGHVAKYMGDGVLAYFGWPRAHEDDAERAVRAGLAIAAAVAGLRAPAAEALQARVGIATGLVVVGELIGEGAAQEQAVVGETPNLAARLQALAEPGTVVVAPSTRRLVCGLFEFADLSAHSLKGFAEPVQTWRVLGEGRAEGRFEARQTTSLTPLIGREEEVALLLRRWQQARQGEVQVVLLSGEPGIGKSRLIRALRERLGDEPYTPMHYQCSPYHQTSPLHPVIEQLERTAGWARDEPIRQQLDNSFAKERATPVTPSRQAADGGLAYGGGSCRAGVQVPAWPRAEGFHPQTLRRDRIQPYFPEWRAGCRATSCSSEPGARLPRRVPAAEKKHGHDESRVHLFAAPHSPRGADADGCRV